MKILKFLGIQPTHREFNTTKGLSWSPPKKQMILTYFVFLTGCKFDTSSCFWCCILSDVFNPKCFELSFFLIFFFRFFSVFFSEKSVLFYQKKIFDLVLDQILKRWSLELDHIVDLRLVYQYLFKAKVICSLTSDSIILLLDKDKIIMQWKNHNITYHVRPSQGTADDGLGQRAIWYAVKCFQRQRNV